jgi:hypothetical protein
MYEVVVGTSPFKAEEVSCMGWAEEVSCMGWACSRLSR